MKPTIEALWNGEEPLFKNTDLDEAITDYRSFLQNDVDTLKIMLDKDGQALLESVMKYHKKIVELEGVNAFSKGYSLATKLITEALSDG